MNKFDMLLKGKQAWNDFCRNHPQFPAFLKDVKATGVPEGTDITVTLTYPDGQRKKAGLHVKPEDMALLAMLKDLK
ncbi:MAG: hypothetical protein KBS74_07835 [Clostridiales bacterium]|nr:hypothetical protein [Candidatus Cacconaster stercorequi]